MFEFLDHIFQWPTWNELRDALGLTLVGLWALFLGASAIGEERARQIGGLLLGYAGTMFLTNEIQAEMFTVWAVGVIAYESYKSEHYWTAAGFAVVKLILFFFWILRWAWVA